MKVASVLIVLLATCGAAALAADRAKLLQLVRASRADVQLVGQFKDAVRARLKGLTEAQQACYRDIPANAFETAAVDYFATVFTDADIDQGLAFYATPLGKKWAARPDPDRGQPPPIELTRKEFEQQEAFSLTRAGNELLAPNGLLVSKPAQKQFERLFKTRWQECGAPPRD